MIPTEEGRLLRIFIGESDHKDGIPLYAWIVKRAKEEGMKGATVIRGIEGYGAEGQIHTARILQLSTNLPLIIEIFDNAEKIEKFYAIVDSVMKDGLTTIEKVFYKIHNK